MTEKSSGASKIGFGDYKWIFEENLVRDLTIIIESMIFLPQENQSEIMSWFDNLSYPWALLSDISSSIPDIKLLTEFRNSVV